MANVTFKGNPMTLVGTEVKVGDQAPNFQVLANDLSPVSLETYKGEVKLISVVPSIDTVCVMHKHVVLTKMQQVLKTRKY